MGAFHENLRQLDLNLLVTFDAIYSTGNISQAARELGLSQPTISNSLSRLRASVGDPLFVRASKGVKPTPKAVQMIGSVREALQIIDKGVSNPVSFDPATTRRHFRMVLLDQLEPILMPAIIRQIQDHTTITIEALHIWQTSVADRLEDGSLDLILSPYVYDLSDFQCSPIGAADVVMAARRDHPSIDGEITLELFETLPHMALVPELRQQTRLEEYLHSINISRHVAYTVTKFWSFPHILSHTDLIAILPGVFARVAARSYPIEIYPLPFDLPEQRVYMTWKNNRNNDAGHIWLREQIQAACDPI